MSNCIMEQYKVIESSKSRSDHLPLTALIELKLSPEPKIKRKVLKKNALP